MWTSRVATICYSKKQGELSVWGRSKQLLVHKVTQDGAQRDNVFGSKTTGISHGVNEGRI